MNISLRTSKSNNVIDPFHVHIFLAVFVIFAHRANVGILCTWKSWNWEENKWNSIVAIPTLLVDNTWKFNWENNICKLDNICEYFHSSVSTNYFNKVFTITSKTSIIPSDSMKWVFTSKLPFCESEIIHDKQFMIQLTDELKVLHIWQWAGQWGLFSKRGLWPHVTASQPEVSDS